MNLVKTLKLNFATCLSFCGNRSQFYTLVCFSLLLNVDITIYPNTQTLTVYMLHRSTYFIMIPFAVLNLLVSDVTKDLCM